MGVSVGFGWGVGGGVGVVTVGRRWGVVLDTLGCWQGVGGVSVGCRTFLRSGDPILGFVTIKKGLCLKRCSLGRVSVGLRWGVVPSGTLIIQSDFASEAGQPPPLN